MASEQFPRNTPQNPGTSLREVGKGVVGPDYKPNITAGQQPQNQAWNMGPNGGPNGNSKRGAGISQFWPSSFKNSTYAASYATTHPGWNQTSVPSFPSPQSFSGQTPWPPPLPPAAAPGAGRSMAGRQEHLDPQLWEAPKRLASPPSNTSSTSSYRPEALSSSRARLQGEREPPLEGVVREDQGRQARGEEKKPWEGMEGLAALDDLDWGSHERRPGRIHSEPEPKPEPETEE